MADPSPATSTDLPSLGWRLGHLFALSGMAIAQPLLSLLGDNPTFFTAHDAGTAEIIWFALLLVAVPAGVIAGIAALAHAGSSTLGTKVHLVLVGLLGALFVLPVVDDLPGPWILVLVLAAAIGGGLAVAYRRWAPLRSMVSVLIAAPLFFVVLFLFISPVSALVFPDDVDAVALEDLVDDLAPSAGEDDDADPVATLAEQIDQRFPPIFLLAFDELPWPSLVDANGDIDAVRFPNFARLADTSHVFTNATPGGIYTHDSVPIMLTGRQEVAEAPVYSLYPDNLFTLLGGVYDVRAVDPVVDLCPPSVCDGAPPEALVELLATDEPVAVDDEPAVDEEPPPATAPEKESGSPFDLLLEDAAIVFGHLVTPDDLDVGLPSISSSWGSFGRGVGGAEPDPAPEYEPAPTTTTTPEPSTTTVDVDTGVEIEVDDAPPVDAERIEEERREFLDSLLIDDTRVADWRAETAAITATDHPQLHYLHVMLPHVPWRLHGDGSTYADLRIQGYGSRWDESEVVAAFAQQRHLVQLEFTDALLGEYLDAIRDAGMFDEATIIVTADHGISFVEGSTARGMFIENIGGIANVPLVWKEPGQTAGVRRDDPVSALDIVPTLAASLEVDLPWATDGRDLFGDPDPDRVRFVHAFGGLTEIGDQLPQQVERIIADRIARFGAGEEGNVYALAGSPELIGRPAADFGDVAASGCWAQDAPASVPDEDGALGYVDGWIEAPGSEPIDYAVVVDGIVAATSTTHVRDGRRQTYAIGDPAYWRASSAPQVELHELVDGRLRTLPAC